MSASPLERLRLAWHRWSVRRKMDRVFSRGRDPYGYAENPYEKGRLAAMEEALRSAVEGRFRRALEIGAAEGAFTKRLAGLSEIVIGLELSPVALARAQEALSGSEGAALVQADVRTWDPPGGRRFDAVVCGDVLYYMDKPLVREEFEKVFERITGWVEPGGVLLLAHGFADAAEKKIRQSYRERFERLGLTLVSETAYGAYEKDGDVRCLLSLLRK